MGSFSEEQCKSRPHILMVPLAGWGHHYQFAQLLNFCTGYEGVTVTFVSNDNRCSELANLQAKGEFRGIDLRLEPLFLAPALYPQDPVFPGRAALLAEKCQKEFEPFARKLINLKEKGLPGVPTCVISDMFLCFAEELASRLAVPWYSVYVASPPYAAVGCLSVPTLIEEGLHPIQSPRRNEMVDIPGSKFARVRDIPLEIFEFPEYWHYHSEKMSRAAGLVFNSAEELDAPAGALDALRIGTELRARGAHRQGPKIFAIGPILNFPGFTGSRSSKVKEGASSPSLEFLNTQPSSSVLYISFGSEGNILPESLTELAHGLEASGVPFVWALKLSGALEGATLPPGFRERTKGRGYIEEGWAPQVQILRHPSTGGFLSHCGWNSLLESLCAGVPVITWPLAADQPLNARFAENVSKSGTCVKVTPGDEMLLKPSREDVSKAVRLMMIEDKGKEFRQNAKDWTPVLNAAVEKGGSSYKALRQLMDEILVRTEGEAK